MTVNEFFILSEVTKDDLQAKISRLGKPLSVSGRKTPDNLQSLSIGDLFTLQSIVSDRDALAVPCKVILKMDEGQVMEAEASEVFGFVVWVSKEMEKINKLFERAKVPPTREEKDAGVEQLNFGAFGILDWYARRMGVHDHDLVARTPWPRVYKCMEMDAQQTMYERRLREVYANQSKRK